jgi:hypothetical protein
MMRPSKQSVPIPVRLIQLRYQIARGEYVVDLDLLARAIVNRAGGIDNA